MKRILALRHSIKANIPDMPWDQVSLSIEGIHLARETGAKLRVLNFRPDVLVWSVTRSFQTGVIIFYKIFFLEAFYSLVNIP